MAHVERNGKRKTRDQFSKRRVPELGYYFIVTDTEETEQNYMYGLRDSIPKELQGKLVIKVIKTKSNNLVDEARNLASINPQYGEIWIIFDRDKVKNFDEIIRQAEDKGINVGWTNPCIEEWFNAYLGAMPTYQDSVACCNGFAQTFRRVTGQKYAKSDKDIYEKLNRYGDEGQAIKLAHYIISSGLKEIIEGSRIADKFKRIYASSYYYTPDGVAEWPAQAVNYTNKTQFIFRIAKGIFEEYDDRVNDSMPENKLYIPYENIVYIGDSATDIPCMRLVKSKGGYSIGVFDPEKDIRQKVYQLFNDGRINYFAPADYSSRSELTKYVKQIIDSIATKEKMKTEQMILNVDRLDCRVLIHKWFFNNKV